MFISFRESGDILDSWLFTNCVSTLFYENPESCFKFLNNNKTKAEIQTKKARRIEFDLPKEMENRLSGDSAETQIYVNTGLERWLKTLNQYPFLCSLKTR